MNNLQSLWRYRELAYLFTWRELRVRYKQSVMGVLWAILTPALIVGAGVLVRVVASNISRRPLSAQDIESVLVRAVIWSFFTSALRSGTYSLTSNYNLVTNAFLLENNTGIFMRHSRHNVFKGLTISKSRHDGVFMAQAAV